MDDLIEMIRRYGDLREDEPIESECGSPARADEIRAEADELLCQIEARLTATEHLKEGPHAAR